MNKIVIAILTVLCTSCVQVRPSLNNPYFPMLKGESPTFLVRSSLAVVPENRNLISFNSVTNTAGQSMVKANYINCAKKTYISGDWLKVYARPFGAGELLYNIPTESHRTEMTQISPMSIISAMVCKQMQRPYGGNPNALNDMQKELDAMK